MADTSVLCQNEQDERIAEFENKLGQINGSLQHGPSTDNEIDNLIEETIDQFTHNLSSQVELADLEKAQNDLRARLFRIKAHSNGNETQQGDSEFELLQQNELENQTSLSSTETNDQPDSDIDQDGVILASASESEGDDQSPLIDSAQSPDQTPRPTERNSGPNSNKSFMAILTMSVLILSMLVYQFNRVNIDTKEIIANYQAEMDRLVKIIESEDELKWQHGELKATALAQLEELHGLAGSVVRQSNVDNLYHDLDQLYSTTYYKLWKVENEKRLKDQELLKMKVIQFYTVEMDRFIGQKNSHTDQELDDYHKRTLRKTVDKFRPDFGSLSENTFRKTVNGVVQVILETILQKNNMFRPHSSHAIGIDLGTTFSCVSYFHPTANDKFNVMIVPTDLNKNTMASVVSIRDDQEVIGDVAKEELYGFPKNTMMSVKRLIGRRFSDPSVQKSLKHWSFNVFGDINDMAKIKVRVNDTDRDYFPEEISAKVLDKLKKLASEHLGTEVSKAVITVPAYFTDAQKLATIKAGKIAGLEVLRIINEPTAAAIAYKLNWNINTQKRNVMMFDFGGGTFDVAVLVITLGKIEVKAVGGDNHLGGDDFDNNLIDFCLDQFAAKYGVSIAGNDREWAISRLRGKCEKAKIRLSATDRTSIRIRNFFANNDLNVEITRDQFNVLNSELIQRSMDLVTKTLSEAQMSINDIDDIVLVGGTTRMPKVREDLSKLFNGRPLTHSVNPDEAVCYGAAIQAAMLNERQAVPLTELSLSDVTPMSLGIEIKGKRFSRVIRKNTKVPVQATEMYYTSQDNQEAGSVLVYEGEDNVSDKNNLLGQFVLEGIPRAPAQTPNIPVTFHINDQGLLHVTAKVESTGRTADIKIKEYRSLLSKE